jgi:hypothetical protein
MIFATMWALGLSQFTIITSANVNVQRDTLGNTVKTPPATANHAQAIAIIEAPQMCSPKEGCVNAQSVILATVELAAKFQYATTRMRRIVPIGAFQTSSPPLASASALSVVLDGSATNATKTLVLKRRRITGATSAAPRLSMVSLALAKNATPVGLEINVKEAHVLASQTMNGVMATVQAHTLQMKKVTLAEWGSAYAKFATKVSVGMHVRSHPALGRQWGYCVTATGHLLLVGRSASVKIAILVLAVTFVRSHHVQVRLDSMTAVARANRKSSVPCVDVCVTQGIVAPVARSRRAISRRAKTTVTMSEIRFQTTADAHAQTVKHNTKEVVATKC